MTVSTPIRVLLAEDHPVVRQSLRTILRALPNVFVVGESITGEEAVLSAGCLQPDIVLMDVNIPIMDGITATRMIKMKYPRITVIGLTCHPPGDLFYAMTKAGAFEVLPKEKALELYGVMQRAMASLSAPERASRTGNSPFNVTSLKQNIIDN